MNRRPDCGHRRNASVAPIPVVRRRGERALRSYGHEHRPRKNTRAKSSHCSPLTRECFNKVVRAHWGAEWLHRRLDVVMNEDHDRSRLGNGPHNLAVLRHVAMNLMQKDGEKGSLRGKIKRADWDEAYLARQPTHFWNAIALKVDSVWLARRLSGAISWMYRGRDSPSSAQGPMTPHWARRRRSNFRRAAPERGADG
jgi:hypothetical protein